MLLILVLVLVLAAAGVVIWLTTRADENPPGGNGSSSSSAAQSTEVTDSTDPAEVAYQDLPRGGALEQGKIVIPRGDNENVDLYLVNASDGSTVARPSPAGPNATPGRSSDPTGTPSSSSGRPTPGTTVGRLDRRR